MSYQYFSQTDFDQCNPPCDMGDMDRDFMKKLDLARRIANIPFIVNSAHRTVEHELQMGRDGSSSHPKGLAVDLEAKYSRQRFKIIQGLIQAGFTRIGIGKNFIHVDSDNDKDQNVVWHYYE